jgi:hypothetical protein
MALTSSQLAFLAPRLTALGITEQALNGRSFGPNTHKGPMIVSSDPARDNLGSIAVKVDNIAHYKSLGGVPDSHFDNLPSADRHITYLGAPTINYRSLIARAQADNCTLESLLGADELDNLATQMRAYMLGDSRKVPAEHVEMLNALRFPLMATYTPGENITITAQNPLIIDSSWPSSLVFGIMTIEPGGYIQANVPVNITAQQIISN